MTTTSSDDLKADDQTSRRRSRSRKKARIDRKVDYHNLQNPFPVMKVFSDDQIAAIHDSALSVLETLGIKVLLPQAFALFKSGGAICDEQSQMVRIGRDMVEAAISSAPTSFTLKAGRQEKDILLKQGRMIFQPGAGAPHATDCIRGRRPGSISDFRDLIRLTDHFDILQMLPPLVEPQDAPIHLRHYTMMDAQLNLSHKVPFVFSRGTPQVEQSFEILQLARAISYDEFLADSYCYTIINTNSPRQLDIPMAQGLIDFARAGQVSIVTPFTLMGAMAPITVAGSITLSHAEALAAIVLTQLSRPGAPVCYGTFTSNVDMKSGAPAFGTPEHFKASLAAGQLARMTGLPWRSAAGSGANLNDVQAANENQFGLWGCLMAGATISIHAAGWLEGGLTVSYEKLVCDVEILQMIGELCAETSADESAIALDAILEVEPGGHFFSAANTMSRYQTEFYEPILHDRANFGAWNERGGHDINKSATRYWQSLLNEKERACLEDKQSAALEAYIAKMSAKGGAMPVS